MIEQAAGTPPICKMVGILNNLVQSSSMSEGGGACLKKSKSRLTNYVRCIIIENEVEIRASPFLI